MKSFEENLNISRLIADSVAKAGGRAYYVGGFVRDRVMKRSAPSADIDIEVHGIKPDILKNLLSQIAPVMTIGESFGIYSLRSFGIDVAMPRTETASGRGHRDFETFVDPFIGPEKAASRRDFTVNALMEDVLSGEIIDCFGGLDDIKTKTLRHCTDKSFPEDPLRVLRAAQFSARLGFTVAPETCRLCKSIDLSSLSAERVEGEMKKALLQSEKPSVFFDFLKDTDQLDIWFPEVKALAGVEQNPEFHAEGDVYRHSMMVLDAAAGLRDRADDPYPFMLSALCHDFGKPAATKLIDGVIHSYGHEAMGLEPAGRFIRRLTSEKHIVKYVENMVLLHMQPNVLAMRNSSVKATNHLFDKSVNPHDLILISLSDCTGMKFSHEYFDAEPYLWQRLDIYREYMSRPFVSGNDLIAAGLKPDEHFREILDYAHKLRLAGISKSNALGQTLKYAEKFSKK